MDLGTIEQKMKEGQYSSADEFHADVKLIFKNCYRYNGLDSPVSGLAKQLEKVFDKKWTEKPEEPPEKPAGKRGQSSSPVQEEESSSDEDEIGRIQEQMTLMAKRLSEMQSRKKQRHEQKSPTLKGKGSKKGKVQRTSSGSSKPKKPPKEFVPEVTFEQKRELSEKINFLSPSKMQGVLELIKDAMPLDAVKSLIDCGLIFRRKRRLSWTSMFYRLKPYMRSICMLLRIPNYRRSRVVNLQSPNQRKNERSSPPKHKIARSQSWKGCWIALIRVCSRWRLR